MSNEMISLKLLLFVHIACFLMLLPKIACLVPPDYCFYELNKDDCHEKPTPVFSYYKPGSRCEIAIWRGCPTYNKFDTEIDCSNTCIYKFNVDYNFEGNWEDEIKQVPAEDVEILNKVLHEIINETSAQHLDVKSTTISQTPNQIETTSVDETQLVIETTIPTTTEEEKLKTELPQINETTVIITLTTLASIDVDSVTTKENLVITTISEAPNTTNNITTIEDMVTTETTTDRVITTDVVSTTEPTTKSETTIPTTMPTTTQTTTPKITSLATPTTTPTTTTPTTTTPKTTTPITTTPITTTPTTTTPTTTTSITTTPTTTTSTTTTPTTTTPTTTPTTTVTTLKGDPDEVDIMKHK